MSYFGIKVPAHFGGDGEIVCAASNEKNAWMFFIRCYEHNPTRSALLDAIREYKHKGYQCVEVEVKEINYE